MRDRMLACPCASAAAAADDTDDRTAGESTEQQECAAAVEEFSKEDEEEEDEESGVREEAWQRQQRQRRREQRVRDESLEEEDAGWTREGAFVWGDAEYAVGDCVLVNGDVAYTAEINGKTHNVQKKTDIWVTRILAFRRAVCIASFLAHIKQQPQT